MNYKAINNALLNGTDINGPEVHKNEEFYRYLLNNRVAYYYSKHLSSRMTPEEARIIEVGENYKKRYKKTFAVLAEICDSSKIHCTVFKTKRYIDEPVDGDIDVLVPEADFDRFMNEFSRRGFATVVDEPGKGKCSKSGFTDIEPHINISWRSNIFLDELAIKSLRAAEADQYLQEEPSPILELLATAGELFYSPEYIDLQRLKTADLLRARLDTGALSGASGKSVRDYLATVDLVRDRYQNIKLPYFLPQKELWMQLKTRVSIGQQCEILFKNMYWKSRYQLKSRLPFTHDWS